MRQLPFLSPKIIIKDSCTFNYYFNTTSIKPAGLDGGNEIILANWLNKKFLECTSKNYIPIKNPDYLYVLINRSILYNLLEAEESFLLDSLVACTDNSNQFKMYFAVNLTFVNYFDNWTDSIMPTIDLYINEDEQILPVAL